KPTDRHAYVRLFLEALIDAPKNLWHPLIVILDEAYVYCSEKGSGESEAWEAVIGMATRGRKRGYCLIAATQRLGKFRKDAASELLNVGIGGTFIDIDRKRAADTLGVYGSDLQPFFDEIRLLPRGEFFFLGPAVSTERVLVKVGSVETTHPEAGSARHAAEPPPAPDKVQRLLPQLADLPKEAEEKARSIADLQKQVRELKQQLKAQPKGEQQIVKVADEKAIARAVREAEAPLRKTIQQMQRWAREASRLLPNVTAAIAEVAGVEIPAQTELNALPQVVNASRSVTPVPPRTAVVRKPVEPSSNGDLAGPDQNILNQLAELEVLGIDKPEKSQLGLMAGYTNFRSGGFSEPLSRLVQAGYATYPSRGRVALTNAGREHARAIDKPLSSSELHERLCRKLGGPEEKILRKLLEFYPEPVKKDELGEQLGYANPRSGGFSEPLGRLRSLGIADYPQKGTVKVADWLFID